VTRPLPRGTNLSTVAVAVAVAVAAPAALLLAPSPAEAHEFRPGALDITALGEGRYEVAWTPAPGADRAQLAFDPPCARDTSGLPGG